MTSVSLPSGEYILVDVPEGAWRFYSRNGTVSDRLGMDVSTRLPNGSLSLTGHGVSLPPGHYTLIGKGSEITEEVAKGIVEYFTDYEMMKSGYKNYARWAHEYNLFDTALESFHSLLRSNGKEAGTTVILKRKI